MRTRTHFMITYVAICLCHHPWNLIIVINIKEAICDSYKKKKNFNVANCTHDKPHSKVTVRG